MSMSNIQRHSSGTKIAGTSMGGKFSPHEREASAQPPIQGTPATEAGTSVIVKPRVVTINKPTQPVHWPEEIGAPTEVLFGRDDSDRFYTSWEFAAGDETIEMLYTEFEGGADFDYSNDTDGSPLWDDEPLISELRQQVKDSHQILYSNAVRTGTDQHQHDSELVAQVKAVSLGSDAPERREFDLEVPAPARGADRAAAALKAWGADLSASTDQVESQVQDAVTDLLHLADRHGLDVDDLLSRAKSMRDEEIEDPFL